MSCGSDHRDGGPRGPHPAASEGDAPPTWWTTPPPWWSYPPPWLAPPWAGPGHGNPGHGGPGYGHDRGGHHDHGGHGHHGHGHGPRHGQEGHHADHGNAHAGPQGHHQQDLLMGALVGAAAAYLLSNESVQRTAIRSVVSLWSTLQGGVEEMKERFRDAEAELHQAATTPPPDSDGEDGPPGSGI